MNANRTRSLIATAVAVALAATMVALGSPAQAQKIRPNFFGIHHGAISGGTAPGVTTGSVRLWDSGVTWRQIETSKGTYDFDTLDAAVESAEAAGLRPLLVLGQTPQFHAVKPKVNSFYGKGASSMPRMQAWTRYVSAVAKAYGNRIDYQIWNEPNVSGFWSGSVAQMAKLTATASKQIRKVVGKKATVVGPSFPLRLKGQRNWFGKYWRVKVGRKPMSSYVSVVAVNLYPEARQAPEAQLKLLGLARRALPKPARRKPMWNTEINYGLINGVDPAKRISQVKQASFASRTLLLNAGSPVRRMFWYAWGLGDVANTHLSESDRTTLTRAGNAWNVTQGWINGTNTSACKQAKRGKTRGLWTCVAKKGRNDVRRIYWKPTGKAVAVKTHRSTFAFTNLAGSTTEKRGRFTVKVGQLPVMVNSRN